MGEWENEMNKERNKKKNPQCVRWTENVVAPNVDDKTIFGISVEQQDANQVYVFSFIVNWKHEIWIVESSLNFRWRMQYSFFRPIRMVWLCCIGFIIVWLLCQKETWIDESIAAVVEFIFEYCAGCQVHAKQNRTASDRRIALTFFFFFFSIIFQCLYNIIDTSSLVVRCRCTLRIECLHLIGILFFFYFLLFLRSSQHIQHFHLWATTETSSVLNYKFDIDRQLAKYPNSKTPPIYRITATMILHLSAIVYIH